MREELGTAMAVRYLGLYQEAFYFGEYLLDSVQLVAYKSEGVSCLKRSGWVAEAAQADHWAA